MKTKILLFAIIALLGCHQGYDCCVLVDVAFLELSVKDSQGVDLLNSVNPQAFDQQQIKLFYLIEGNVMEVVKASRDNRGDFEIFEQDQQYRIRIFLNDSPSEDRPTTYIQWSKIDTDTIRAEFTRKENSVRASNIWLNGKEIWSPASKTDHYYEMTK